MLYIAYGSNLHVGQMKGRCPAAVKIGKTTIPNMRLVFRGVADIEPCEGASVPVGVWYITKACERALDRYEGISSGLYRKEYLPLRVMKKGVESTEQGLVYVMNGGEYSEPGQFYYETIHIGYGNFGLPIDALKAADKLTAKLAKAARAGRAAAVAGEWEIAP